MEPDTELPVERLRRLEAAIDRLTDLLTAEVERRTPAIDGGMLTVAETAAILRWSEDTIWRRCKNGDIPHIRHGRAIRIPRHALEHWLLEQTGGHALKAAS
jgi:excisionase family DNA binding protein